MENIRKFESFPVWMVVIADMVAFGIYIIGSYIMFHIGAIWGWLYILFCLFVEVRVMRASCMHCYYYGKWCGLGRGKLAALLFRKGDPKKFIERKITWRDLIPDVLVSLIPFALGIYLIFIGFSWLMLALILLLLFLTTFGNGSVRRNFACKYCKQRELGCPAEKLFARPERNK